MPRKRNKNARPRLGRVRVRAERRPEPDWDRFGWALLHYAKTLDADAKSKAAKPTKPQDRP
jgi:hypothetical protein